jgi:hypothetical protein
MPMFLSAMASVHPRIANAGAQQISMMLTSRRTMLSGHMAVIIASATIRVKTGCTIVPPKVSDTYGIQEWITRADADQHVSRTMAAVKALSRHN